MDYQQGPMVSVSDGAYRGETAKARARRLREGFFEKYIREPGIDIGCRVDPVDDRFRRWDAIFGDADATWMEGVPDQAYATVYCSHILEHLADPAEGLRNWHRITAPGGHLVVLVPHRDLYERRTELPSRWNLDHKSFWLPDRDQPPHTLGLRGVIEAAIPGADIVSFRVLSEGWERLPDTVHATGEYSIEAIIRKPG